MQARIVAGADKIDRGGHLDNTLCAPVGGLQRYHNAIGCAQRGKAHEAQAGRAVEQDVIVVGFYIAECVVERKLQVRRFPLALVGQVEGHEGGTRREYVDVREARRADKVRRVGLGARIEQPLDAGGAVAVGQ